jgi:hypothetical protein
LLRQDMLGYIDAVEMFTDEENVSDEDVLTMAREHTPRLISAIRGALRNHQPDIFGLCLGCGPSWTGEGFVRAAWPCGIVNEMHKCMLAPENVYGATHAP